MRPFVLDTHALGALRRYAEENMLSLARMKQLMKGNLPPIGDNPNHVLETETGYRIVFSHEQHPKCKVRHVSVSVDGKAGAMPNPLAVEQIIKELGYLKPMQDCILNMEEYAPDRHAINVLEVIDEP